MSGPFRVPETGVPVGDRCLICLGLDVPAEAPLLRYVLDIADREPYRLRFHTLRQRLRCTDAAELSEDQVRGQHPGVGRTEFVIHKPPEVADSHRLIVSRRRPEQERRLFPGKSFPHACPSLRERTYTWTMTQTARPTGDADSTSASSSADGDTQIEELEQELSVLWRRARASSHRIARDVHPDMEPSAYGLMVLLHQQGSMRLTDLAAAVGVGKPSLSRQVAMLQTLGLVQKHADPVDGRAQSISLTDTGAERLEGTAAARKEHFRRTWTGWDPEELTTLVRLLHKLNASVRA